jgi:trk system potassium uptake protein TrkH
MLISVVSVVFISFDNYDLMTTVSAVLTAINNIGPGLSLVGPASNFSSFSALSKMVMCADMLIGRLEIYPILLLFSPSVWLRGK